MIDKNVIVATRNSSTEVQATVVNIPAIDPGLCGATTLSWLRTSKDLPEFALPAADMLPPPSGSTSRTPIVVDGRGAAASSSSHPAPPPPPPPAPKTDDEKVKQASTNASGIIKPVKKEVEEALARHDAGKEVSQKEWQVPALPSDHHHDHLQHHQHQRAPQTSCHQCHHQCHHPATTGAHQVAQGRPH